MSGLPKVKINAIQFSRAMEALSILGGQMPEDYEIKNDCIYFSNNPNEEKYNYMEFRDNFISIIIEKNGFWYRWFTLIDVFGEIREKLDINSGSLIAVYFQVPHATTTSGFYLYNSRWGSPKIYSDVNNAKIIGPNDNQIVSLDDYYNLFVDYMRSKKRDNNNSLANNPEVIETIIKMYEKPIKNHVYHLNNDNQIWRFQKEKEYLLSNNDVRNKSDKLIKLNQTLKKYNYRKTARYNNNNRSY